MVVVGLTGSIASGKSIITDEFKKLGAKIIDADKIAHQLLRAQPKVKKEVIHYFGKRVLNKNRNIDRKELGKIVFADKRKRKILENIVHPFIIKTIKQKIKCLSTYPDRNLSTIIIDASLLLEAKMSNLVDKIIVVFVPEKVQLQRLMKRDRIDKKEAKLRISSQWNTLKKVKFADFIIDNTRDLPALRKRVKVIWNKISDN